MSPSIYRLTPPPDYLIGQRVEVRGLLVRNGKALITVDRLSVLEVDGERSSSSFWGRYDDGAMQKFSYDNIKELPVSENVNEYSLGQTVHLNDHKGGDVIFMPGPGWKPVDHPDPAIDGNIIFKLPDNSDFLVIKANGDAFVQGEKVASKQEFYDYFAAWLVEVNIMPRPPKGG